jgi:hypothetical protein
MRVNEPRQEGLEWCTPALQTHVRATKVAEREREREKGKQVGSESDQHARDDIFRLRIF